jgi:hypothetical protein
MTKTLEKKRPSVIKFADITAESVRRRKAKLDPHRVCSVPGCSTLVGKENLGSLCVRHRWRAREAGHPWHPMPLGKERKAARQAVVSYLEHLGKADAARLMVLMNRATDGLRETTANAIKPAQIRREANLLTTNGKAQIVFGWLNRRNDFERLARRMLIEAMTLEVWAACFYHGQKRDLPKLLDTTVGRTAVWFACKGGLKETKTRTVARWITRNCYPASEGPMQKVYVDETTTDKWRPSNYVRVAVGRRVFLALREILPANWVTDQMIWETLTETQSTKGEPHIAA